MFYARRHREPLDDRETSGIEERGRKPSLENGHLLYIYHVRRKQHRSMREEEELGGGGGSFARI
jgi:hypothetical protein